MAECLPGMHKALASVPSTAGFTAGLGKRARDRQKPSKQPLRGEWIKVNTHIHTYTHECTHKMIISKKCKSRLEKIYRIVARVA